MQSDKHIMVSRNIVTVTVVDDKKHKEGKLREKGILSGTREMVELGVALFT